MSAVDRELGYAGVKSYIVAAGRATFVVTLFDLATGELAAVLEADALGQRRTGAASGVAAKYLAKPGARSLGVIGCGWQAESQVAAIRAAVPSIETVVAYCRTPERLEAFCGKLARVPAESSSDAAAQDVVVTVTNSPEPVLRGEWLRDGALVCAVGANRPGARELDDAVLERAAFICCDSREQARLESADLIEPVDERPARLARRARAPGGGRRRGRRSPDGCRRRRLQVERAGRLGRGHRSRGARTRPRARRRPRGLGARPRSCGARRRSCRCRSP